MARTPRVMPLPGLPKGTGDTAQPVPPAPALTTSVSCPTAGLVAVDGAALGTGLVVAWPPGLAWLLDGPVAAVDEGLTDRPKKRAAAATTITTTAPPSAVPIPVSRGSARRARFW